MRTKLLLLMVMSFAVFSCTTNDFELDEGQTVFPKALNNDIHKISEEDALDMVGNLFKKTRSVVNCPIEIEYVLNEGNKTRSTHVPDTLAYILNFGNDNGFAVIASDDRVFPLLAYSDNGHFKYEKSYNDPVYVNFISLLDDYMAAIDENDTAVVVPDNYLSSCVVKRPQLKTCNWSQVEPFDKYVIEEHPGCPAGCVAVAAGQIMANCKNSLNYHDFAFNFRAIRAAMDGDMFEGDDDFVSNKPTSLRDTIEYSYDEAVDQVAKLLYWLGKDLNMIYDTSGSSALSRDARDLLDELGYGVNEAYLTNFSEEKMLERLEEECLLYVDGRVIAGGTGGHAWVIDGYSYCWKDFEKTEKGIINFHCDWGWGGGCNGYYNTDIYTTDVYTFGRMQYFSVPVNRFISILN